MSLGTLTARRINLWEGEAAVFVARIESAGGTPLLSAQVSSFSVSVYLMNGTTPPEAVYVLGAIPSDTGYYNELQHDDAENLLGDSGGYNFKYTISADEFSFQGGNTYRVQIISQIGNSSHVQVYDVSVGEVFS